MHRSLANMNKLTTIGHQLDGKNNLGALEGSIFTVQWAVVQVVEGRD